MKINRRSGGGHGDGSGIRWCFLLWWGLVAAGGCADRTYLTRSHGRACNEAFQRQVVNPTPLARSGAHGDSTQGLDSQEAAAVARSYRQSLSGKEAGAENAAAQQMVTTNPANGQAAAYMPPPSVPNGQ